MVTTQIVTAAVFLEMYSRGSLIDPVNVKVGTEQRIYARTTEQAATLPEKYKVVYCVV